MRVLATLLLVTATALYVFHGAKAILPPVTWQTELPRVQAPLHQAQTDVGIVWYADRDECARAAAGEIRYDDGNRFGDGPQDPWGGDNVLYGGALWIIC